MDFRLVTPVLASNCWTATPQPMVNELWEKTYGQLQDLTGVIISDTTPDASDEDKMWVKTDGVNGPPIGQFIHALGQWLWPVFNWDDNVRVFWRGELANLPLKDGGTIGVATLTTGPFWELDPDMNGKIPIGVGGLPSGATLANGDTGGNDEITLQSAQLPPHRHYITIGETGGGNSDLTSDEESGAFRVGGGNTLEYRSAWQSDQVGLTRESGSTPTIAPTNILNPYLAGYWIRMTQRKYYTG